MSSNIDDIIGSLYDMVQDARAMPLAADKCILERDRVLDMLDEIIAQLPITRRCRRSIVGWNITNGNSNSAPTRHLQAKTNARFS